jgi:hypothetical protein
MDTNDIKPSTIMLIAGGAVLVLSTFLDWISFFGAGVSGWNTDTSGILGILVAVIGLAIAVGVGLRQFSSVEIPDQVLGFDSNQLHLVLGFSTFLITFGLQFRSGAGIGVLLGWISSAVIVAAAIIDTRAADTGGATPPTQF